MVKLNYYKVISKNNDGTMELRRLCDLKPLPLSIYERANFNMILIRNKSTHSNSIKNFCER